MEIILQNSNYDKDLNSLLSPLEARYVARKDQFALKMEDPNIFPTLGLDSFRLEAGTVTDFMGSINKLT